MNQGNIILQTTANLESLEQTLKETIVSELSKPQRFCLWLKGEMGAGKTTLTKKILDWFGLHERTLVTSPTYSYINEYEIEGSMFAHIDFYRADPSMTHDEIGVTLNQEYRGLIIEWPQNIMTTDLITPTHMLTIESFSQDSRQYSLARC